MSLERFRVSGFKGCLQRFPLLRRNNFLETKYFEFFYSQAEFILKHGKSPINCVKTYYKDRVLVGRSMRDLNTVDSRLFEPALIRIIRFEIALPFCLSNSGKSNLGYSSSSHSNFQLFEPIFIPL